jgi:hypothetical protein
MKNLFYIFILSVMLITMAIGCMSCGRVVKETTKTNTVVDSASVKEKDSIIQVKTSVISRLETELRETQYSGISFFREKDVSKGIGELNTSGEKNSAGSGIGTPCPENKVTIKADGSIEASGNIKSASVVKDKLQRALTDLQYKYDSLLEVKEKVQVQIKKETNIVTKFKDRGIPGWFWAAFFIGMLISILAGALLHRKLSKMEKI